MSRPPKGVAPGIPDGTTGLTPAWLGEALHCGGLDGVQVSEVEIFDLPAEREARSRYATLRPKYARRPSQAPASLFVKLTDRWPADGLLGDQYGRELRFYEEVAPRLRVRVPRLYYGAASPDGRCGVILLEDLTGARREDSLRGLTPRDLARATDVLASLHAQWWERRELASWRFLFALPPDAAFFRRRLDESLDAVVAKGALGDHARDVLAALSGRFEAVMARLRARPQTLVHFDFRPENLFFGVDGDADRIAAFDWGMVGRGPGAYDLANLAIRATRPRSRDEALSAFTRWVEGLRERGVHAARDALLADYRVAVLLFLFEYVLLVAPAREWEYARAMLRLGAEHAELVGAGDVL